jgi:phosphoribosylformylglycinamidine cyclo-ligase
VRSALLGSYALGDTPQGLTRPLVDELLEPCAIYATDVLHLARSELLHAASHITGGGFDENVPRVLPPGLGAELQRGSWPEPPIFAFLQRATGTTDEDLFATFNMGIGMVLVADPGDADAILARAHHASYRIGRVTSDPGVRIT